jgi:hypothetical protein
VIGKGTPKTGTRKRTKFGLALEESAKEILAHAKGTKILPTRAYLVVMAKNREAVLAALAS